MPPVSVGTEAVFAKTFRWKVVRTDLYQRAIFLCRLISNDVRVFKTKNWCQIIHETNTKLWIVIHDKYIAMFLFETRHWLSIHLAFAWTQCVAFIWIWSTISTAFYCIILMWIGTTVLHFTSMKRGLIWPVLVGLVHSGERQYLETNVLRKKFKYAEINHDIW